MNTIEILFQSHPQCLSMILVLRGTKRGRGPGIMHARFDVSSINDFKSKCVPLRISEVNAEKEE